MRECLCLFFKQKTAYEVRMSDWSSDVCSSDLFGVCQADSEQGRHAAHGGAHDDGLLRQCRNHVDQVATERFHLIVVIARPIAVAMTARIQADHPIAP